MQTRTLSRLEGPRYRTRTQFQTKPPLAVKRQPSTQTPEITNFYSFPENRLFAKSVLEMSMNVAIGLQCSEKMTQRSMTPLQWALHVLSHTPKYAIHVNHLDPTSHSLTLSGVAARRHE